MFRGLRHTTGLLAALAVVASAMSWSLVPADDAHGAYEPDVAAIVNGSAMSDADFQARWPFLVALVTSRSGSQYDGQFCGGSLVDDQHVVTAAHCVTIEEGTADEPKVLAAAASIRIVAGSRVLDRVSLEPSLAVRDVFVHPDFAENAGDGFRNDVAVLRLAEPLSGAPTIRLVQPGEEARWGAGAGGVTAMVAGWGDTDPLDRGTGESKFPVDLREATIPLHADSACATTVGGGYGTAFERATNLCGGQLGADGALGRDACQGDSGGPLVVGTTVDDRRLAGVTSWGEGCAQDTFGAYARIDALRGWIDRVPGATDGGPAIAGPGGTLGVVGLRRTGGDYQHVRLAWSAAGIGTAPERYAIWRRTRVDGDLAEELVGITTATSFRARATPSRRANSGVWNVRPLVADGSNGPSAAIKAGPNPDVVRPSMPALVVAQRRGRDAVLMRWGAGRDGQSGVAGYDIEHRVLGFGSFTRTGIAGRLARAILVEDLVPGDRIVVRVRTRDAAGNTSAWRSSRVVATRG